MQSKREKMHVRVGDFVGVTTGTDKGKRGRVLLSCPKTGKVVVEGVRFVWKHVRPSRQNQKGGRIQIEAPVHASNVMLLCQNRECKRFDTPVRTKAIWLSDGRKARGCHVCGAEIVSQSE